MRKVLSGFIAVCLVLSLFTGAFAPVPSARALSEGDFQYELVGTAPNQTATITGYTGAGGAVAIPSTIGVGPYAVTSIGVMAFWGCAELASVTIPNSVTTIGNVAFYACPGLTSVVIPDSVTSIGDSAFYFCSSLTSVTIPNSVINIGGLAFGNCSSLTILTVDPGNPSYSSSADGVLFNKTATLLVQCPGGKQGAYVIPNSVTGIGIQAFWVCWKLTSVIIGSGVTSIGGGAFGHCSSLTAAYFLGNPPTMGDDVFASCAPGFTIYYLIGTTGWTNPWYGYPTATFTPTTSGTDLVLLASWNLVSVAVPLPVASIPGLQAAYGYHDGWSVPTTLTPGQGYWVQVQNAVTVPLAGTPGTTPVSFTYQAGWQLLGNPFDVPLPISSITNHALITTCYSYGPAWGVLNPATDSLQPGKGYWILLSASTTLTLTRP